MGLISWIIIGLLVGFIAWRFFPGRAGAPFLTLVLAVAGALIGGYISAFFNNGCLAVITPSALLISLAGALIMVLIVKKPRT